MVHSAGPSSGSEISWITSKPKRWYSGTFLTLLFSR
jgi:hypothetical protein